MLKAFDAEENGMLQIPIMRLLSYLIFQKLMGSWLPEL